MCQLAIDSLSDEEANKLFDDIGLEEPLVQEKFGKV